MSVNSYNYRQLFWLFVKKFQISTFYDIMLHKDIDEKLPNKNFVHEYKNDLVDRILIEDICILFCITFIS